jgi:hypothetical protein
MHITIACECNSATACQLSDTSIKKLHYLLNQIDYKRIYMT